MSYVQHYAYDKAESHFDKAIDSNTKRNDSVSLAINYANLLHLYVLAKNYDKYDSHIAQARMADAKVHNRNRFYYYETEVIRLYDLKKFDSLIYVSKKALHDIKNGFYFSVYSNEKQKTSVKNRSEITFELFLAYALMEKNLESSNSYKLLNKLEKIHLEEVLWFSPRVFEHISRVRSYKELYHIRQQYTDKDSILYYKNEAAKYAENANDLLTKKSAEKTSMLSIQLTKKKS